MTCIRGEWFWNSFVKFATPKSAQWHHAHAKGNDRFLHYHWGRMLFRVISFSKACIIHPGTLGSICDHQAYERLYEEIKREEVLDNPPQQGGSSSSRAPIDTKVEDVAPDIMPASPTYSESLGVSHGTEDTKKFVKRRWTDYASEKEENEEQAEGSSRRGGTPRFRGGGSEERGVIRNRLDRLNKVAETLMSNLQETARDHLQACRSDFQYRCLHPDPNAQKGAGRIVHHMNETFGPDHKALEGFDEYEESLKAALVDEMTSLMKKADLAKDAPMPSVLQKEKEKDWKIELARLADAVKGAGSSPWCHG